MGLDISFNRSKAVKAGLEFAQVPNGTPEEIARELVNPHGNASYKKWLEETTSCIKVPGTDLVVRDVGPDIYISVRANYWGPVYEPLTDWLKANAILWSEH